MKPALALLLFAAAVPAYADDSIADFESPDSAAEWEATDGSMERIDEGAHAGSGALLWRAKKDGARLATKRVKGDLTECNSLRGWIWLRGTVERVLVARLPAKGGVFWRKFTVRPGVWSEIVLPFYQFRSDGVPRWTDVEGLEILLREGPSQLVLDDWRLVEGGTWPAMEPTTALEERVFGDGDHSMALTENFRVFTDAEMNARDCADRLEAGLERFRKVFGLEEVPLDYPVTLIVRRTPEDYRRTAVETARDVYGGELEAPKADGFTFLDYSFGSYEAASGARRPTFLHEACHQLVSRMLEFRGDAGSLWIEEGICYLMQNDFYPQEDLRRQALELLEGGKSTPLDKFDGKLKMSSGALNLQSLLIVRYLLKGPNTGKWSELHAALRENQGDLLASVEDAWGIPTAEFEKGWESFTREWATEK